MAGRKKPARMAVPQAPRRAGGVRVWVPAAALAAVASVAYVSMNAKPDAPAAPVREARQSPTPVYGYEVVREYPHDRGAFTQGLVFREGHLFESTGQYGQSTLRKVELASGRVLQQRRLEARYFAEGLADWNDRLIQLTWQANVGFVYDLATFDRLSTFSYPGEGWGLTHDGSRMIMSDGTSSLRFLDPETLEERSRVRVLDGAAPVDLLNELEFVDGQVYANVWGSDRIAVIDPASGRVSAWIDLAGLLPAARRAGAEDVLNGIAYDPTGNRLFVTGKLWPSLFEIRVLRSAPR